MAANSIGLNQVFPIYNEDGTPFHDLVLRKGVVDSVVMSLGDKITGDVFYKDNTLQMTMKEYVEYNDILYSLVNPPTIVREGMVADNNELKGMTKYSFEFYHPMYQLGNFPFTDVATKTGEEKYLSQNKTFSWIGKPQDYIDKLNKNLQGTVWYVRKSDRFPIEKDDELSEVQQFDNINVAEAIKKGYEIWGVPYIVSQLPSTDPLYAQGKRFVVEYGLPSNEIYEDDSARQLDTPFVFHMGQGVGLKNNSRTPRNNKIVTRIAGYGSEDNVPYGYPQIVWTGNQDWDYTINNDPNDPLSYPIYNGIVGGQYVKLIKHPFTRTHLMPSIFTETVNKKVNPNAVGYDPTIEIKDYYDAIATQEYPYVNEINPQAPSYESHEFADIKPEFDSERNVGIIDAIPLNADLTPADHWDDSMDDDGNYLQSYFQITLPQLDFDLYACAAITQEMQINMRSGACIGCTFTVQVDWEDYKRNFYDNDGNFLPDGEQRDLVKYPKSNLGQISVVVQKDNTTFGVLMPNIYQQPKTDDLFVFIGISLPLSYITSAELRLDDAMKSYMLENNVFYFDYPLKFDEHFLATHTHILEQIRPNSIIHFDYGGVEQQLFVKQITVKYGNAPLPQYDITLTDNIDIVLNQIGQVANDVENLSSLISILRQSYSRNIWNEIAKKLSKSQDDVAQGLIGFVKGLWVKANGLFGIDENGDTRINDLEALGRAVISGDATIEGVLQAFAKILANHIESENWSGDGAFDTGFRIRKGTDGVTSMVVDNLFVRMKAIFTELEIRKISYAGGNIIFSHAGSKIVKVKPIYSEYYLYIPDGTYDERHEGINLDNGIYLPADEGLDLETAYLVPTDNAVITAYRCYILKDDGTTATENWWRVDDQARCQTFNVVESGHYENVENTFYWRRVVEVGTELLEDGKTYDYIDLSATDRWVPTQENQGILDGKDLSDTTMYESIPKAGDQLVQMGNRTDSTRQGFISIEVSGEDAPAFKVYKNVSGYVLENKRKICLSPSLTDLHVQKLTIETDYGVSSRVPVERGNWGDITDHKCYYYDLVQHNCGTWLCIVAEGSYTTDEPSENSGVWRVYAQKGTDGVDGKSFSILGSYDTYAELIAAHPTGDVGDAYMVGGDLYVWDAENNEWHNSGQIKGEDGNNYVSVYTLADSQPAVPSGSSVPPTGWFTDIPQLNNVSAAGDFSEDNGWRKASGNHVANAFIKDTLTFTTTQPNQKVFIQIRPSSEEIYDIIAVGLLDTDLANRAAVNALDASRKTSGTTPKTVVTIVATAGQHTLCIAYSKDESDNEGEDSAWYRVAPVDVYISTAVFKDTTIQGTWSTPTRFSANSEDSVSVLLSPGTLLVNQDMEDLDNLSDLSEDVFVSVYKGAVPQVITNITKTGTTHCNASVGSNYVRLTAVLTDANNKYYDNGSIAFNVTFRDSDTGELKTITGVIIRFNANLLGSWSQKVEGDMETIIAQKTTYTVDGNTYTVQKDLGTFVKSSTENISTLTSQMKNGKNLFGGVLTGTGWKSASSNTPTSAHDISVDSDGWFDVYSGDTYMISPAFSMENGQKYTFSYEQGSISNNQVYLKYLDTSRNTWVEVANQITSGSSLRKSVTFDGSSEVVGKDMYIFIYRTQNNTKIIRPQLELGDVASTFDAGTTETTSEMKQTANEINLSVRGDVAGTNINLLYGVDGYTSSNKLVHKMKAADGVIEYRGDNDHPHIFSSVQLVKGCTYTIQCVTDGNIASSHSTSGTPSSKLCTIWLRMDGTLNGGYSGECFTSQYSGYENLGNGRHKWTFVCQKTGEYWFRTNSYSDGTTEVTINFWNIKLEGGSSATDFTASTSQMASQINQTANSIELNVKNGLEEVGVYILGGSNKVVAKAGTFEVQNNSGTKTFEIDSDGNLQGSGNAAFKGTIKSGQYTESGQTKYANQINDDGSGQLAKGGISWDAAGNTTFEGNIKAQGGTIGGFKINQSDLENTDYGAGITIQNAASNPTKEVKIGADATDTLTGRKAAMVAKATEANTSSDRPYNTALFLQAKNAKYNYAVHGEGNNVLNGYTQGYKVKVLNNIGTATYLSLNDGKVQAIASVNTNSDKNIYLPTLGDCCKTLGIDDSNTSAITDFCCEMTIINQSAIQSSTSYNRDNVYIRGGDQAYNAQITSLTARPVVLAQGNPKKIEINNCTTCNVVITYINKRFIANYVKTVW